MGLAKNNMFWLNGKHNNLALVSFKEFKISKQIRFLADRKSSRVQDTVPCFLSYKFTSLVLVDICS